MKSRYHGAVMGHVHAKRRGHLVIRDIATKALVKCSYPADASKTFEALPLGDLVTLEGQMVESESGQEMTRAERFESPPSCSDADYEAFFGCAPGFTGGVPAAEYVRMGRD